MLPLRSLSTTASARVQRINTFSASQRRIACAGHISSNALQISASRSTYLRRKTYYTKCHFMAKRLLSPPPALPPPATTFTIVTSTSTSNKWSESVYNAIQHLWNNKWHNLSRALCVQCSPRLSLPSPTFTTKIELHWKCKLHLHFVSSAIFDSMPGVCCCCCCYCCETIFCNSSRVRTITCWACERPRARYQ